ncbi:MAG: hypothetical protein PHC86_05630 [Eubacteriales bacterium]|nr:hypothetical protein [Eubacteriales bacterium]
MKTSESKPRNWFWPVIIIGGGILFLMKALGIGEEYQTFKVVGSLLLLAVAVASLSQIRFFMFLVPLSLIAYIWRVEIGFADMNVNYLLVATIVISIGLSMIFHKKNDARNHPWKQGDWAKSEEILNENEIISIDSSFSEQTKYIHANNLKKVGINCQFGETKVYFDQCQISPEGLEINLNVKFAGVVLLVPRNWLIENHVAVFAATVKCQDRPTDSVLTPVRVTGNVNFGEVKIEII